MDHKRVLHMGVLFLTLLAASIGLFAQPPAKSPGPLNQIAWLTGGTWVAELKDDQGVPLRIENRMRWSDNGQLIKFVTTFISHNKAEVHYEGIYAWDASRKQISFWYTDREGNLTQGTAAMAGETLTQDFAITHLNGNSDKLRSLIVRDAPDSYAWSVMGQKDGSWNEIFHLRYTREN